jgi:hypothetical protein
VNSRTDIARERIELLVELDRLDERIGELRDKWPLLTYELEWAVRERDRLVRHVASLARESAT